MGGKWAKFDKNPKEAFHDWRYQTGGIPGMARIYSREVRDLDTERRNDRARIPRWLEGLSIDS